MDDLEQTYRIRRKCFMALICHVRVFSFIQIINSIMKTYFYVLAKSCSRVALPTDAPDPPVDVETHNPTSSTTTLTWKPPMYDGGCKIMGYILEMQQKGDDKWERCNDFLVPVLSYTVKRLKEGKNYTFRVKAENAAGVSEPSRNTPFIKALDAVGKEDVFLI